MLEVNYTQDVDAVDAQAQAAADDTGRVRIRVQPYLYRERQYVPWEGARWLLQCENAEEAIELRETLKLLFELVKRKPTSEVRLLIQAML